MAFAKSQLEVYSSSDSKSAFAFGSEPNDKGLAAGSIISMMANFMGISGEISRIKGRGGVPVYAIINPDNGRVFAMDINVSLRLRVMSRTFMR